MEFQKAQRSPFHFFRHYSGLLWSAGGLLKLNVDLGILNVYLEKSIFHPIGSQI